MSWGVAAWSAYCTNARGQHCYGSLTFSVSKSGVRGVVAFASLQKQAEGGASTQKTQLCTWGNLAASVAAFRAAESWDVGDPMVGRSGIPCGEPLGFPGDRHLLCGLPEECCGFVWCSL